MASLEAGTTGSRSYGGTLGPAEDAGVGLRAYGLDGKLLYHLFGTERVWRVEVAGPYAYARSDVALRIVALSSGEVVRQFPDSEKRFSVMPGCAPGQNAVP